MESKPSMSSLRSRPSTHWHHPPHNHVLRSKTADGLPFTPRPQNDPYRPKPPRAKTYDVKTGPWQHMAETYAWVVEQEYVKLEKKNTKTEEWVLGQQIFLAEESTRDRKSEIRTGMTGGRKEADEKLRKRMWEELMYGYEEEAERWMRQEEEARRMAAEREKQRRLFVQDEIRRIQTRVHEKRESERQRIAGERNRAYEELKERERQDQARTDRATVAAWDNYETRWAALGSSSEPLTFAKVPWPLVNPPTHPMAITPAGMVMFLFAPVHSPNQTRKERIRRALLRWHPDRFRRLLNKVADKDREAVEEGVGAVARCLNDLMARETNVARYG